MTVRKIANISRYLGLSSDTKPTSVEVNSYFIETDTKDVFTTYDGTSWTKYKRNSEKDMSSECRRK